MTWDIFESRINTWFWKNWTKAVAAILITLSCFFSTKEIFFLVKWCNVLSAPRETYFALNKTLMNFIVQLWYVTEHQ